MAVSDEQYLEWLQRDYARRIILVEAEYHNGVTTDTQYFSTYSFTSYPTDTPANICYDDILNEVPRISNNISEVFGGASRPAIGDIVIDNSSGERDSWLEWSWNGYPIRLYLGDSEWERNDFRLILDGVTADIQARSSNTIVFKIRDKQDLLNKQIQSNLIASGENIGNPIPLCYGEVFQISPVLIDAFTSKYQVHDGAIEEVVAVYQDGVAKAFTPDIATGTFTLTTPAEGVITVNVKGAKPSGTYLTTVGDICKTLAIAAGLDASEVDDDSVTAINAACPQTVGVYITERTNLMTVLDFLMGSVGGFYGFSRLGKLRFGRFAEPTGIDALELSADDVESNGVDIKTIIQPTKTLRLGYKKYYTQLTTALSGFVTEAQRADFAKEYRVVTASNTVPEWPLALEPELVQTALTTLYDAQSECDRRALLNAVPRRVLKLRAFTASATIELGDEVLFTYPRYGLDSGVNGIVVGIVESPTSFRMELEIWL